LYVGCGEAGAMSRVCILNHHRSRVIDQCHHVEIFSCQDVKTALALERKFIRELDPLFNQDACTNRARVLELRSKNLTFAEIGERLGLTRQRVHQLVSYNLGSGQCNHKDRSVRIWRSRRASLLV
jgi:DNA-binding CsgD family transcriptional regulator